MRNKRILNTNFFNVHKKSALYNKADFCVYNGVCNLQSGIPYDF